MCFDYKLEEPKLDFRDKRKGIKKRINCHFQVLVTSVSSQSSCETVEFKMSRIYNLCTGPNTFSYQRFWTYNHFAHKQIAIWK